MADSDLGARLRQKRIERNHSLSALARKAGVGKATLSRWEAGRRLPSMTELEATLMALELSHSERVELLSLVDAPRAVRRVRQLMAGSVAPPASGDLLRAMRLRQGRSQTEVAAQVGVSQATLARWERSEAWPTAENLHRLCYTLQAREAEIAALTAGPMALAVRPLSSKDAIEALYAEFRLFRQVAHDASDETLHDLRFLTFEAAAWGLAQREEKARWLLDSVQAYYASYLTMYRRYAEAAQRIQATLASPDASPVGRNARDYAIIAHARGSVFGAGSPAPRRGVDALRAHLSQRHSPEFTAWFLSDLAEYLTMEGDLTTALRLTDQAIAFARRAEAEAETHCRLRDRAKLLLRLGRPDEALPLLNNSATHGPRWRITTGLVQAEAEAMLGDSALGATLAQVYAEIEAHRLERYRPQADALRQRLSDRPPNRTQTRGIE